MAMTNREPQELLCRWHHMFPGLDLKPTDFYGGLQRLIEERGFPEVHISRVEFGERGIMSAKRLYLRIARGNLLFDVCAAPFGSTDFFVSYWMGRTQATGCMGLVLGLLVAVPILGIVIERSLRPMTYYEQDSAIMFQEAVHGIILAYVDELAGARQVPAPVGLERNAAATRLTGMPQ